MKKKQKRRITKKELYKLIDQKNRRYWKREFWKNKGRLANLVDDDILAKVLKEHKGHNYGQPHIFAVMGNPAYYYFAQYIPTNYTVIDFGCSNNSQAYFFSQHRQYIGVEPRDIAQFQPLNSSLYRGTAQRFLIDHEEYLNRDDVYAIVSCSPDMEVYDIIRIAFKNRILYAPGAGLTEIT